MCEENSFQKLLSSSFLGFLISCCMLGLVTLSYFTIDLYNRDMIDSHPSISKLKISDEIRSIEFMHIENRIEMLENQLNNFAKATNSHLEYLDKNDEYFSKRLLEINKDIFSKVKEMNSEIVLIKSSLQMIEENNIQKEKEQKEINDMFFSSLEDVRESMVEDIFSINEKLDIMKNKIDNNKRELSSDISRIDREHNLLMPNYGTVLNTLK